LINRLNLLLLILTICIIGAITNYGEFKNTYTLGNLIQAGGTIFIAIVGYLYFQKSAHSSNKQKEIIIKQLEQFIELVDELCDFSESIEIVYANGLCRKINVKKSLIKALMEKCNFKKFFNDKNNCPLCQAEKLRDLVTGYQENHDGLHLPDCTAKDNQYIYSRDRLTRIHDLANSIKKNTVNTLIDINNS
jgi:hypothetical protein